MKKFILSVKRFPMQFVHIGNKCAFVITLLCCVSSVTWGQVFVTPASNGTTICSNTALDQPGHATTILGMITVLENQKGDFGGDAGGTWGTTTITLSAPTGWQFDITATPTFNITSGSDLGTVNGAFVTGQLVITLTGSGKSSHDQFTITGLGVNAVTAAGSNPGNITPTYVNVNGTTSDNYASLALVPGPTAISGNLSVCAGSTTSLSSTPSGGTWSSSATAIASVSTAGMVTGVPSVTTTSTVTVTYTTTCGSTSSIVTVNPLPTAITGPLSFCVGAFTTLNSTPAGGTWTSNSAHAPIDPASGVVTGSSSGNATISYTLGTNCAIGAVVTVNVVPTTIGGTMSFCAGQGTTLNSTPSSGAWSSSNGGVVINSGTGVITSTVASSGTSTISYTLNGCAASTTVSVNPQPTAITGTLNVCATATTTLNSTPSGGTWTSSNANATVDASGDVTGGAGAGTAIITYALGSCTVSATVTVAALPGVISGSLTVCKNLTTTLTCTPTGGTWASSNALAATVIGSTGVVTGVNAGTSLVSYTTPMCGSSAAVTVTVNALPANISGVSGVCIGSATTLTDTDPNGGTWSSSNTTNGTIGSASGTLTGLHTGPTTITYTDANTNCQITTVMTVNPLPNIASTSNSGPVCVGAAITLNNSATGITALHYAWTGPNSFNSGTSLTSATTFTTTTAAANGVYTVTVTDNNGCSAFSTTNASVSNIPTLTGLTTDKATYCSTTPVILTATGASGNGSLVSYNWSGPALSTTTTSVNSKTIPSVTVTGAGVYSVTVTYTGLGCTSTYSVAPSIAVNPTPSVTTTNKSTCDGAGIDIILQASTPSDFTWIVGTMTNTVTGASASVTPGTEINQTLGNPDHYTTGVIQYLVTPTSSFGCTGLAASILVSVYPTPLMTATASATTCGALTLPLNASVTSNFAWTIGTILPTGTSVTGASASVGSTINQSLADNSNSIPGSVQYIVTPTSTVGSCIGSPETITVTVNPAPQLNSQTSVSVCSGSPLSIPLGSLASSNFTWTVGTTTGGISGAHGSSGTTITDNLLNSSNVSYGTQVYIVTPVSSSGSCTGAASLITVTVNPLPSVTTNSVQATCSDVRLSIPLTASMPGSTFTWGQSSQTGGITGGTAGNTTTTINDLLDNPSHSASGKVVYSVRPQSSAADGMCLAAAALITVNVMPTPTVTSTSSLSSCGAFTLALTASTGSSFSWTAAAVSGTVSGESDGAGNNIIQTLSNSSSSTIGVAQYTITPTSTLGTCLGTSSIVTVNVNPGPTFTMTPTTSVCSGTRLSFNLGASTPSNFVWSGTDGGIITGTTTNNHSALINDLLSNSSNILPGTITYSVTITSTAGSCAGSGLVTVTVNPLPSVSTSTVQATCSGIPLNIGLTASIPGSTFTWGETSESAGISGGTNGITTITDNLANTSHTTTGTATYTVLPTSPAGNGFCTAAAPTTLTVAVYPTPTVTSTSSVSNCGSLNLGLTASTGSNFAWTVASVSGGVTGSADGFGNSIVQSLSNPSDSTVGVVLYSVTPTSTTGTCLGISSIVTVNVNPGPTFTMTPTTSVCSDTRLSFNLGASTPSNFVWSGADAGTTTGTTTGNNSATINDVLHNSSNAFPGTITYSVLITSTAGSCVGSGLVTVTVNPLPTVSAAALTTVCSGFSPNVNLSPSVPSSLLWSGEPGTVTGFSTNQSSTVISDNLHNGSTVSSATIIYTVVATSNIGSCVGPVKSLMVSVNPLPAILGTVTDTAICSNSSPGILLNASITSTYTWNIGTLSPLGSVLNASSSHGNIIDQNLIDTSNTQIGTVPYLVTPTSVSGGCAAVTPTTITVVVKPSPIVTSTAQSTICSGTRLNVHLLSTGGLGSTFTWIPELTSGTITGMNTSGGTVINDSLVNPSNSTFATAIYNVTPISSGCPGASSPITVVVNPKPTFTGIPPQSVCSDTRISISLAPSTAADSSSFAWTVDPPADISGAFNGSSAIGSTSNITDSLTNASNSLPQTFVYSVTPSYIHNSLSCTADTSKTVTITVNPKPGINTDLTPLSKSICSNTQFTNINLHSTTDALDSLTIGSLDSFIWSVNTTGTSIFDTITSGSAGGTLPASINQILVNSNSTNADSVQYKVTPISRHGCIGNFSNITVVVNPAPQVQTVTSQYLCSDSRLAVSLSATTGPASTYTWLQSNVTGGITGGSLSTVNSSIINDSLHNPSNSAIGTVVYSVVPTSPLFCLGVPALITVSVNPLPHINNIVTQICSGAGPDMNVADSTSTLSTFSWTVSNTASVTSATLSGAGSPINPTLTNTGNSLVGTIVFTVIPTSVLTTIPAGCVGAPTFLTVSVNPIPQLTSSDTLAQCSEDSFKYNAASSTTLTKFYWSRPSFDANITGIFNNSPSDSTGVVDDFISSNHLLMTDYVTYPFTLKSRGCVNFKNVVFTVNPRPAKPFITLSADTSLCANTLFQNFSANAPADASLVIYEWTATHATVYDSITAQVNRNVLVSFDSAGVTSVVTVSAHVLNYGCYSDSSTSVKVSGTIADAPATIIYRNDLFICEKNNVDTPYGYQWGYDSISSLRSVVLQNEINQSYLNAKPDTNNLYYWVEVIHNGCPQKSYYMTPGSKRLRPTTEPAAMALHIYPNPAQNTINIDLGDVSGGNFSADIFDITGRKLMSTEIKDNVTPISVADFSPGYYIVECRENGIKVAVAKFIKN